MLRGRKIGFVFQEFNLIPTLTALENVALPLKYSGRRKKDRRRLAEEMLSKVGLGHRLYHRPSQLSGGEQQRVAVARALVSQLALVLADEPTGELDSQTGEQLMVLLRQLNQELGTTFIIVTHDQSVGKATDCIIRMSDRRIFAENFRK